MKDTIKKYVTLLMGCFVLLCIVAAVPLVIIVDHYKLGYYSNYLYEVCIENQDSKECWLSKYPPKYELPFIKVHLTDSDSKIINIGDKRVNIRWFDSK